MCLLYNSLPFSKQNVSVFCLMFSIQCSSMLLHVSVVPSFIPLSIPLYDYTTFLKSSSEHFVYISLYEHMLFYSWINIKEGNGWLKWGRYVRNFLRICQTVSKVTFYGPISNACFFDDDIANPGPDVGCYKAEKESE